MKNFNWRILLAFAHDIVAVVVAWLLAFWLRFTPDPIPAHFLTIALHTLLWIVPLHALLFFGSGLYRGIWRFASTQDLKRIVLAVGSSTTAIALVLLLLQTTVPRTVLILHPLLLVLFMGGSRFAYRIWKEGDFSFSFQGQGQREPVAIVGAGDAAATLIKDLTHSKQWRAAALFDDDAGKIGRELNGVRVLGDLASLPAHCARLDITHAIIAMPSASHTARRRAVEICRNAGIIVMTVPSYDDLISGKVTVSQIRHVELDDLLGRDPVVLDASKLKDWIGNRCVLITGAGGSIGSELCRQIARFAPSRLVLFEANEYALYQIEQEFQRASSTKSPQLPLTCAIGDVKNKQRIEQIMRDYQPSVVFHAAAYKHVPLMENENAWQAIQNNVAGTLTCAQAALRYGVEKFVLVSTDKAVNPTNVMGASKRLAEMVCQSLQSSSTINAKTNFVMVRFGNVLGSTGSVIPKFREQIAAGGPVTVTHPEIRRYFMSIPEAAQLVLQAGLMGSGGEIFVLDMGEPVLIADLARDLIRLSGFTENEIKITYTGLRPGEKLYEELLADSENTLPTPHPKLRIAKSRHLENHVWLEDLIVWLDSHAVSDNEVRRELSRRVPEYQTTAN